mgnify:CR=1 FL=1
MGKYKSVFIREAGTNWIIKILGDDIYHGLESLGYVCRKGQYEDYQGEEVAFSMWWRYAQPYKEAKLNGVFITHTDDPIKELDLVRMKDEFDFFITMSPEDAQFLIEIGFDKGKVFGLNLPTRNMYVRPIAMGIFSANYDDHRKNDHWLQEYCSTHDIAHLVNFVFIGKGWGKFLQQLENDNCSYQWVNISRKMPYEYLYQQLILSQVDYYVYMGMDGGAMGTYDAYAMGVELCVSDDGYHKSIPDIQYKFSTKEDFFLMLDNIIEKQVRRLQFFEDNNSLNYSKKLAYVFENLQYPDIPEKKYSPSYSVIKKRRSHYFGITFERVRQPLVSLIIKYLDRRRAKTNK